jgi:hypothetical protein
MQEQQQTHSQPDLSEIKIVGQGHGYDILQIVCVAALRGWRSAFVCVAVLRGIRADTHASVTAAVLDVGVKQQRPDQQQSKGVSTPPATCPLPRGGRVNDCSWLKRNDKRVRDDRDARVATQLQANHEIFEFWPLRPCSL